MLMLGKLEVRERLGDGGEEAAAFQRWGTGKEGDGHVVGANPKTN